MVQKLSEIKAESGRDLDSLVDENLLIPAETAAGTFGALRFFQGIKNFFKGISALGTLSSTGRIPTTDVNGNVSYVTPQQILDAVSTINGDKNFANNVSVGGALNVMGVNLDTKINNAVGSKQDKYVGTLGSSHTFDDNGVFLVQLNCSYANSQFYEVGIFVSSFDGQFPYYQRLFISPLVTDSFSIIQNGKTLLVNPYWGSAEQRNNCYWQVFKVSNCYY